MPRYQRNGIDHRLQPFTTTSFVSSYSAPDRGAEYCDKRVYLSISLSLSLSVCVCVCVCVCVFVHGLISSELHVGSSPNFWARYLRP